MAFTGNEEHSITLAKAVDFTKNYRESVSAGDFLGGYFSKKAISGILAQPDCVGIRVYNGIDDNGIGTYVIVGVTAANKDLSDGELAEYVIGCPPVCPDGSPLAGTG